MRKIKKVKLIAKTRAVICYLTILLIPATLIMLLIGATSLAETQVKRHKREASLEYLQEKAKDYPEMSREEREHYLSVAFDYEAWKVGLAEPVFLAFSDPHSEKDGRYVVTLNGAFNYEDRILEISDEVVIGDDVLTALEVIAHETFHVAQWDFIGICEKCELTDEEQNNWFFRYADKYREEFDTCRNLASKEETDLEAYYCLNLEEDARLYANSRFEEWYGMLDGLPDYTKSPLYHMRY